MTTLRLSLHVLCMWAAAVLAEPAPGRVPRVYNALITSNQNLEPSKAYPVYQPVLHDAAFAFPYQPVFYGQDFPITNSLLPAPALLPQDPNLSKPQPTPSAESPVDQPPSPETPSSTAQPDPQEAERDGKPTQAPPLPPNTQSPIPLNEFGLPAQILPLGRIDPAFNGFTQFGPFTYTYPGLRFYDPDPFSLSPYSNFPPFYRQFANVVSQGAHVGVSRESVPTAAPAPSALSSSAQTPPPSEPNDLNVLNYSSKDPNIPNVPPPPLPQGGLKSDKSE